MDYTTLSLAEVSAGLGDVAREARAAFGHLSARQLNWRPDATRWSVAQCLDHLITANRLIFEAAEAAVTGARPRTVWQRLPILPGILGRMLIRSQSPAGVRKFTAPLRAQPGISAIAADIVQRFVEQHGRAVARVRELDDRRAARAIMTSPFIPVVTYSVLDGWRLVLAHDWRHLAQARRVMQTPGFPGPGSAG
jgi:hypothetical protein